MRSEKRARLRREFLRVASEIRKPDYSGMTEAERAAEADRLRQEARRRKLEGDPEGFRLAPILDFDPKQGACITTVSPHSMTRSTTMRSSPCNPGRRCDLSLACLGRRERIKEMTRLLLLRLALLVVFVVAASGRIHGGEVDGGGFSRDDFPEGFVFGAGTSAYQWEGAAAEDGRTPSIFDTFAHAGHNHGDGDVTADGYHKYKEDIKLMKQIGLDAFRFSISWSRLIPNGRGKVNPIGLEFYNNLINELLDHGIQPHATICHLDPPQVLEDEYNGWRSPQIIADFTAYADVCFREFGDRVTHWTTLNEPNAFATAGYDTGLFPPGRCSKPFGNCSDGNSIVEPYIVAHHCLLAHSSAASLYKRVYQKMQKGFIGINIFMSDYLPVTNSAGDIAAAKRTQTFFTGWFLDPLYYGDYPVLMKEIVGSKLPKFSRDQSKQLMGSVDFLGINYYAITRVKDVPQDAPSNKRDFMADISAITNLYNSTAQVYMPSYGVEDVLEYFKQSYGNPPIYIHENGYPMSQDVAFEDGLRVKYLSEHLRSLLSSLRSGSNTKGYFVWSLVDLYEPLKKGYQVSFGLYSVDFASEDLERHPRRSAVWYADFLKGRIESERSFKSSLLSTA